MNDTRSSGGKGPRQAVPPGRSDLLGIYLNDHLAGATAAVERAAHMVRTLRGTPLAETIGPVGTDIAEDRRTLMEIMQRLGIPVRRYKVGAAQMGERLGRLKTNGRLVRRSPLSSLLELEALQVGVEGKAALWEALRRLTDDGQVPEPGGPEGQGGGPDGQGTGPDGLRLDPKLLDDLLERARQQARTLGGERRRQAAMVFREG